LTRGRYDARELIASILLGAVAGAPAPIALKG
jgi:hypothetical protein